MQDIWRLFCVRRVPYSFLFYTFNRCSSLRNVLLHDSVTRIGDGAFGGCRSLQHINIPNNVTKIGHFAFVDCCSLQNITIPEHTMEIGCAVFDGCHSLQSINVSRGSKQRFIEMLGSEYADKIKEIDL